jgi:uncharacterized membrane protein YgcG
MKVRYTLAACAAIVLFASPASSSIISASSQTARAKPAERVDYLSVTSLQNDLNASLRSAAENAAPSAGATSPSAPSSVSGGLMINAGATSSSAQYQSYGSNAMEYLFDPNSEKEIYAMPKDATGDGLVLASNSNNGNNGKNGNHGNNGRRGGHRQGGKNNGGGGGGVHAAPEPSTWLLLGVGMLMIGAWGMSRRRAATFTR